MITSKHKELALWAKDFLLKNKVQACRIGIYSGTDRTFEIRDNHIEHLQQAEENQLIAYLFVEGRYGSFSTNRLEHDELETFFRQSIASTRLLAVDEARQLPDPTRCFHGNDQFLSLYDPQLSIMDADEKLQLAFAAAHEVDRTDPRIISVASSYGDNEIFTYLVDSNGLEAESASSSCGLSVSVSVKGEGDARPESYWYDQSVDWESLSKTGIGTKALQRTLMKIGQRKIQSGVYSTVIDAPEVRTLLSPLLNAMYGASIQQNNSFLKDKIGQQVASECFTLTDDPIIPKTIGARCFDGEGMALRPMTLFSNGILQHYYIDTYHAHKLHVEPTTGSPSVLRFALGNVNLEGLLRQMDRGIYITGFNGGNCNSSTGNFSYGIEGFWVENGVIQYPISEMNITGNLLTLWSRLLAVGNDPFMASGWQTPTLLFEGADFSGL
ncbi:MAG: TldD/PmbA family protein [Microbacter sp.]